MGENFKLEFDDDMVEEVWNSATKKWVSLQSTKNDEETLVEPNSSRTDASTESTKDEDKENVTPPPSVPGAAPGSTDKNDVEWIRKRQEDEEKEEQELKEALQMSLREQEDTEQRENDEIRRATELSLQELNNSNELIHDSDEEQPETGQLEQRVVYPEDTLRQIQKNACIGNLPYSYKLVSVVSHLGSSTDAGHYICDALDIQKNQWRSYDDSEVTRISEINMCTSRQNTGYVFFYYAKEILDELDTHYKHGQDAQGLAETSK